MSVQRNGIELGQDSDAVDVGVDTVADGDVDQTVFAGDGHSRFGALFGQRVQARAAPTAHDEPQDVVHCWHENPPVLNDDYLYYYIKGDMSLDF